MERFGYADGLYLEDLRLRRHARESYLDRDIGWGFDERRAYEARLAEHRFLFGEPNIAPTHKPHQAFRGVREVHRHGRKNTR